MVNQATIQKLIAEHQRVKGLIPAPNSETQKPKDWSFSDMIRAMLDDVLDKKIDELGLKDFQDGYTPLKGSDYFTEEEIQNISDEVLSRATPIKGIHYFDGEIGKTGRNGLDGQDGKDGKDGKNPSTKEVEKIFKELLGEVLPRDIGAMGKLDFEDLLGRYEKKSGKSLEKRLNALQDAVMRNYGGHGGSQTYVYDAFTLDGVTKSFSIPVNNKILMVGITSAPFFFQKTTDYTGEGTTTLSFTSNIDAATQLAGGQYMFILYK